jgi:hypothetical protein
MVMNILPGLNFPGPKDAEDKSKDHQSDWKMHSLHNLVVRFIVIFS